VEQSFARSLVHLGASVIDSYVLHGPSRNAGLTGDDWAAWHAMEKIHDGGQARFLGVSNVSAEQLQLLLDGARVKPRFVQNRCYASRGWDRRVREICAVHKITYQGFSLLTANADVLARRELLAIARKHGRTASQVVFRFCLDVGMLPLTGTTSAAHMREDLDVANFQLTPDEVAIIERIAG
jgi:diketogulonate reductase-like aldo/keto reductase